MAEEKELLMWAGSGPAAVYLTLAFVAGAWVEPRPIVWKLAVFSSGMAYLCTLAKSLEPREELKFHLRVARVAFWVTVVAGAGAGICLL